MPEGQSTRALPKGGLLRSGGRGGGAVSGVAGCGETECFGKGIQGVVRQRRGDGAGVSRMPWRALLGTGAVEQWCRASMHSNTESYHVSSVPPEWPPSVDARTRGIREELVRDRNE